MSYFDHRSLTQWFDQEKRSLPWRDNPSPYHVWISEVMLQQTQVAVVIPYFLRWMELFPTIQTLAHAPFELVIKCWEGLGYYARARALHAGAKYIVNNFDGILPSTANDLLKIQGIGPYTAGAILNFAFRKKAAAVDGNVMRVLSRYFLIEDDFSKPATVKKIWSLASAILPDIAPWSFNEALIELGAIVCKRKPDCHLCPLNGSCKAYGTSDPTALPFKSKKIPIEKVYRAVAIIQSGDHLLVQKVTKERLMCGLHEFPYFDIPAEGISTEELSHYIQKKLGLRTTFLRTLEEVSHSFTRFKVHLSSSCFDCLEARPVPDYEWKSRSELDTLAFSSGHRSIYAQLK